MVNIERESETELIDRLINILACKQFNYQTKLNDSPCPQIIFL